MEPSLLQTYRFAIDQTSSRPYKQLIFKFHTERELELLGELVQENQPS